MCSTSLDYKPSEIYVCNDNYRVNYDSETIKLPLLLYASLI